MGFAKTGTHDNDILELVLLTFKKKLYEKFMIYSTIFLSLHIKKNVCRVCHGFRIFRKLTKKV